MPVNLTPNAISAITGGDVNSKPLVQVLDIKQIGSAQERFRFLISDSVSSQHAMLATQLNDRVKHGHVKKGSIIQLIDYICSEVQKRKIIVVLNFEIILPECEVIGNPKTIADTAGQNVVPGINSMQAAGAGYNNPGIQNRGNNVQSFQPGLNAQTHGNNLQSFRPSMAAPSQGNVGNNLQKSFRSSTSVPVRSDNAGQSLLSYLLSYWFILQ